MAQGIFGGAVGLRFPRKVEAKWWIAREDGKVKCILCPQGCVIGEGETGKCLVRKNEGGKLWAISYGNVAAIHLDPIEKKPLFHFYPTYNILSVGGLGCNFSCKFCQNWELVEGIVETRYVEPEELVELAIETKKHKNIGIAFTYNEPTIWFEYILDTAKLLKEADPEMKVVLVTNGYISAKPFEELAQYIDAMNIDLKFADDSDYIGISDGHIKPVVKTIMGAEIFRQAAKKIHVEVTYLVITDVNDSDEDFEKITDLVAEINPDIPFHISRYFPHFQMKNPPTPPERLMRAWQIAKRKLKYVYVGNLWGNEAENTYCPSCGNILIERIGFSSKIVGIKEGKCSKCGYKFYGVLPPEFA